MKNLKAAFASKAAAEKHLDELSQKLERLSHEKQAADSIGDRIDAIQQARRNELGHALLEGREPSLDGYSAELATLESQRDSADSLAAACDIIAGQVEEARKHLDNHDATVKAELAKVLHDEYEQAASDYDNALNELKAAAFRMVAAGAMHGHYTKTSGLEAAARYVLDVMAGQQAGALVRKGPRGFEQDGDLYAVVGNNIQRARSDLIAKLNKAGVPV